MRIGTTPTFSFELPIPADIVEEIEMTFIQNEEIVLQRYMDDMSIEDNDASYKMTQEETFLFNPGKNIILQARVLTSGGDVLGSEPWVTPAKVCYSDEVLK